MLIRRIRTFSSSCIYRVQYAIEWVVWYWKIALTFVWIIVREDWPLLGIVCEKEEDVKLKKVVNTVSRQESGWRWGCRERDTWSNSLARPGGGPCRFYSELWRENASWDFYLWRFVIKQGKTEIEMMIKMMVKRKFLNNETSVPLLSLKYH